MKVGRPAVKFTRAAELREVTLALGPWLFAIPVDVVWDEITPTLARGRLVAIGGEDCKPFRVEIAAEPEISAVRLARPDVSPSSMGPAPRLTDHLET